MDTITTIRGSAIVLGMYVCLCMCEKEQYERASMCLWCAGMVEILTVMSIT